MNIKVENAKQQPIVLYGKHFRVGIAEYADPGKEPYRVLINEDAAKKMDATFPGCPIYVLHVDKVDLHNIQAQADGYVTESFFNKADGAHWAKFVLVSDAAHKAYRDGWQLSNAYLPKMNNDGGQWQGVDYHREVVDGKYEHLALVPNPRYQESVILTPEEFKKYNADKDAELSRLANSKGDTMGKFSFFKREKVENATGLNLEEMLVVLPLSKKEISVQAALEAFDKIQNMNGYACNEHMVKVNDDEEMSVADLAKKYSSNKEEMEKMIAEKKALDNGDEDESDDEAMQNSDEHGLSDEQKGGKAKADGSMKPKTDEAEHDAKLAKEMDDEKAAVKKENFEKLKNARGAVVPQAPILMTNSDRVALGKSRYGSK